MFSGTMKNFVVELRNKIAQKICQLGHLHKSFADS